MTLETGDTYGKAGRAFDAGEEATSTPRRHAVVFDRPAGTGSPGAGIARRFSPALLALIALLVVAGFVVMALVRAHA